MPIFTDKNSRLGIKGCPKYILQKEQSIFCGFVLRFFYKDIFMRQDYELVKSLSGHSGCTVDLCKMADNFFIRKTAGVAGYNKRLKKQYIKQLKFELSGVSVPKIYNHGSISDVFYFDMEFVDGITLAEYMHKIKVKEIVDLMTVLFKALESCKTEICPKAKEIFRKKIDFKALTAVNGFF